MATKKKQADELVSKTTTDGKPTAKATVEVDWGRGFVEHNDAVVTATSIKVPVPLRARHALGQSQTRGRYDRIRVKLNGDEVRIGERRYHTASKDSQPSLTFEILA